VDRLPSSQYKVACRWGFFIVLQQLYEGPGRLVVVASSPDTQWHTHTHTHTLDRTSLGEGSARRIHLYLVTLYSQETDFHVLGGIRTPNPSKRAAADTRLRLRGHWDRSLGVILTKCYMYFLSHYFCVFVRLVLLDWVIVVKVWFYEDGQSLVPPTLILLCFLPC
jgi:hypothetical protein